MDPKASVLTTAPQSLTRLVAYRPISLTDRSCREYLQVLYPVVVDIMYSLVTNVASLIPLVPQLMLSSHYLMILHAFRSHIHMCTS